MSEPEVELIERLAREAGVLMIRPLRMVDNGDGTMSLRQSTEPTPFELTLRRFAVLLAAECASIAENRAAAAIRKKFGVRS